MGCWCLLLPGSEARVGSMLCSGFAVYFSVCAHGVRSQPHSHTHQCLLKPPLVEGVYDASSKSAGSQRLPVCEQILNEAVGSLLSKRDTLVRDGSRALPSCWEGEIRDGSGETLGLELGTGLYLVLCLRAEPSTMLCSITLSPPS